MAKFFAKIKDITLNKVKLKGIATGGYIHVYDDMHVGSPESMEKIFRMIGKAEINMQMQQKTIQRNAMRFHVDEMTEVQIQFFKKPIILEKRRLFTTHCVLVLFVAAQKSVNVFTGIACQSPKDQYSKTVGKKLALTRALEDTTGYLSKEDREIVWDNFFARFPRITL